MQTLTAVPNPHSVAGPEVKLTNSVLSLTQVRAFLAGEISAADLPKAPAGPLMETVFSRTYSRPMSVAAPAQMAA